MIPIGNLYYMLCYAWNRLDERDLIDVNALDRKDLPNLLARLLCSGVRRLLRQGIDRSYIAHREETQNPKGKIDITATIKQHLLLKNSVMCLSDHLSDYVLHNCIIRTTIHRLALVREVDATLVRDLKKLELHLVDVPLIPLQSEHFSRVQLHRNVSFYKFLLKVCELCFFSLLAEDVHGEYRFRDFVRDKKKMRKVFQDFVYNFYNIEQKEFAVSSERFKWDTTYMDKHAEILLPSMLSDVCLSSRARRIVIECKFTAESLQENWANKTAVSEHLYQLFAYLKHQERKGGICLHADGLLLYPTATQSMDFMFDTQGHTIRVATLDLQAAWTQIETQLLSFLKPWRREPLSSH